MAAVRTGRKTEHGPIPKLSTGTRRRIDRQAERHVVLLKQWRAVRAKNLAIDPGVLCPNSSLEAIAWRAPSKVSDLEELPELKIGKVGDDDFRAQVFEAQIRCRMVTPVHPGQQMGQRCQCRHYAAMPPCRHAARLCRWW